VHQLGHEVLGMSVHPEDASIVYLLLAKTPSSGKKRKAQGDEEGKTDGENADKSQVRPQPLLDWIEAWHVLGEGRGRRGGGFEGPTPVDVRHHIKLI
jgi:hypothetical protein